MVPNTICGNVTMGTNTFCMDGNVIDFTQMTQTTQREEFYDNLFFSIPEPSLHKKSFALTSADKKPRLQIVLIETTETLSPRFKNTLYNIAHVYGGSDNVSFLIIAHAVNKPTISNILKEGQWMNVDTFYVIDSVTYEGYQVMLCSKWFWRLFTSEFVLITHTDSIIFKQVDEWMFEYPLFGAPWPKHWFPNQSPVGNGGYTLKNVTLMLQILETSKRTTKVNEDIWWSWEVAKVAQLPTEEQAFQFAFESRHVEGIIPTGAHKIWAYSLEGLGDAFRLLQTFK